MVIVGVGTNLGNRNTFREALHQIMGAGGTRPLLNKVKISFVYQSEAMLPPSAPTQWNMPFLNMAIGGETDWNPQDFMEELKAIEKRLGRTDGAKWSPRLIDLDLLCWNDLVLESPKVTLPHPGLLSRPFALWPLADLDPEWRYPVEGDSYGKSASLLGRRWNFQRAPYSTHRTSGLTAELMGIINVTPDSFSDGGHYLECGSALEQALKMVNEGVAVIDVGAESTRPGASPVDPAAEWTRLGPVLKSLKEAFDELHYPPKLSVDTRHVEVAEKALQVGVDWINDVSGVENPQMGKLIGNDTTQIVVMHNLGIPPVREKTLPYGHDPVSLIYKWAERRFLRLQELGVEKSQIIFDPGLGFGKGPYQSLQIIKGIHRFRDLGVPLLLGHSRKSFFSLIAPNPFSERDLETALVSDFVSHRGVDFLRVHNVVSSKKALLLGLLLK